MKIDSIIITLVFSIVLGFIVALFYNSLQDNKKCIEKGGTNVRTEQGYECMKVQKL